MVEFSEQLAQVTGLVRFLLERDPTEAELDAARRVDFDLMAFRLSLLLGQEGRQRFPQLEAGFRSFVAKEKQLENLPNKLAHGVASMAAEVAILQQRLDGLGTQIMELVAAMDSATARLQELNTLQSGISDLSARCLRLQSGILMLERPEPQVDPC